MKLRKLNGEEREFPNHTTQAFAALAKGDPTEGQCAVILKAIFALGGVDDIAKADAPTRQVDMMDGARWLARTIGQLTGAGVPHEYGEPKGDD